jgi:hypothetical protein
MWTSPEVGEWDLDRARSDGTGEVLDLPGGRIACIGVDRSGCEPSVPLLERVRIAPASDKSGPMSRIDEQSSVVVGDKRGETTLEVSRFGSYEYRSKPAVARRVITSCSRVSLTCRGYNKSSKP